MKPTTTLADCHCRLCQHVLDTRDVIGIGPFPKAAQYYPEPEEFATETGVILELIECCHCGLTQLLNAPVDYYRQVITAASLSPAVREQRLALFRQLRAGYPATQTLKALEIGCAQGDNLPLLAETGYSASGIESDPDTPAGSCTPAGVLNQYLTELGPEHAGQYDLLLSFNYLEHQPDTRAFLEQCHTLLAADGQLLITVPNLDFLLSSRSGHEFVADHLVYFTAHSLENALRLTGFEVLDLQIINNQYDLQILARKRPASPILACKQAIDTLVQQLNQRLDTLHAAGKKVAVWGAGHRTLALLSLANYRLIDCIIDSAKFKHYKYAPLSHLRILPPEILLEADCGIDVILVMVPGIYPAEVIRKIESLPIAYAAEQFPPPESTD
jgi:2-polyprenyl-3-methyl-5-hydroxy-6-metoxy-1,4-benzoquinol methylase